MRNNISHRLLYVVLFISLLLLVCFTRTTAFYLPPAPTTPGVGIDNERHALLDFKASIDHDPRGLLSTWSTREEATSDCCEWFGVTCNNQTGHIISLDFGSGDLQGKISPSLLNLSHLSHLDLGFNHFTGTIPKFIGSLTQLRYLNLGFNHFTGTIPNFIGSLTQLRYLRLDQNDFTGTIPPELGNLTNLQELSLRFLFSCTVENLDWLSRMSKLEELQMDDVKFMGKADNWVNVISSLQKLSILSLRSCGLSQVMHPYSHVNSSSSSSIVSLDLENNNLNSSLYNWLFPLTSNKLEDLSLDDNKLDRIPKYFGNLCSLTYFYFSSNTMPISFPNFLKNLSGCTLFNLSFLYLYNGQFRGSLSNDIQNFSSLNYLDISNNRLNGTISEKVWQLPELETLFISSNSLQGGISKNIRNSKILNIDVSNNSLQEVDSEVYMSKVAMIDMSSNNIYGTIPNISSTVIWLDLSKNRLHGGLSFLCGHVVNPDLYYLDLSNNSLTGKIPDCLWHFKELQLLDLGYNKLFGKIHSSVNLLKNLKELYLNNNNFSGQLPLSLSSCTKLILIDLGANKFSGSVPFWIGEKLSLLYALSLTSNNFSGTIPSQLCQLANLQLLDLSKNNLHGTIPPCLGNLTAMVQEGYVGNAGLCGLPLSKYCPGDKELQLPPIVGENNGDDDKENMWFYIGGAIGFAIGFWTVCIVLLVYNPGRHAFFHFMNTLESWIYVKVMVFISKLQHNTRR
ncbi:hypothetical protein E3N88_16537 [Mikania micrantha]|uniref:Uncharacterized protein n=1 Tax=Mikania micrantha TaxID=192012 RepID=A0A5N6NZX6_9ASTR|nr:hypothetical protein E3N88_16537 [Mikania micrantha]